MFSVDLATIGTNNIALGDADPGIVGRHVFQIVDDGSLSTSIVVKARVSGAGTGSTNLVSVPYRNRNAEDTLVAAGTAITAAGIYEVNAAGVEIVLVQTFTSGAGHLFCIPLLG